MKTPNPRRPGKKQLFFTFLCRGGKNPTRPPPPPNSKFLSSIFWLLTSDFWILVISAPSAAPEKLKTQNSELKTYTVPIELKSPPFKIKN